MTGDFNITQSLLEFAAFNPRHPLTFLSVSFWFFFALVLAVDSFVYRKPIVRHAFLFAASLFFYYKTSHLFFLLLLFTVCSGFILTGAMHRQKTSGRRKALLALAVSLDLLLLAYFKYAYFFTDAYNAMCGTGHQTINWLAQWSNSFFGTQFSFSKIILPAGISFYTFQAISYYVDVYRGEIKPLRRLTDYGFYVSFFPQLVAGPIVRASQFIPQMQRPRQLSRYDFGMAIFWILNGLLKKVILADYIATQFIDRVFENPVGYSGFENLSALIGYSLQVYADFSGYTDIAIGVSLLMGFRLQPNFDSPYKATSLTDFWRRWHISLSQWLRNYLYIPLGGNKRGSLSTYLAVGIICLFIVALSRSWLALAICFTVIVLCWALSKLISKVGRWLVANVNLMLTMLIGGLWHGASWNFIIWGGLNGLGLVLSKALRSVVPFVDTARFYWRIPAIAFTFSFITLTRVWFRTGSGTTWSDFEAVHDLRSEFAAAGVMLGKIFWDMDWKLAPRVWAAMPEVFAVILAGFIIHWLPSRWKEGYRHRFASAPVWLQVLAAFIAVIVAYQFLASGAHPFIYFQF